MSKQTDRSIIFSVCIGGFLEFYEFNLFIYLAPIIALHYFRTESAQYSLLYTLLIGAVGFISRPLGGFLFGYVGDRYGRKIALISSIIMITLPTIGIGLLPAIWSVGVTGPLILLFLRLMQGVLTGGELSGIMCYLTEDIAPEKRRYVSSWAFFGPQLGGLVSILECIFLERQLTYDQFINWGWRISFLLGGGIGLIGCFLRSRLHETPLFAKIKAHKKVLKIPLLLTFSTYKKHLLTAFLICALPISSNFLIFSFSAIYFQKVLGLSFSTSLMFNALINALSTLSLPILGKLTRHLPAKPLLITCTVAFLLLIYPFYLSLNTKILLLAIPFATIITLLVSCYFALIPMILAELFPTTIRYTSIGISYTTASSIIGGTAPLLAIYLLHTTGNPAIPSIILITTALLSLTALIRLKETKALT